MGGKLFALRIFTKGSVYFKTNKMRPLGKVVVSTHTHMHAHTHTSIIQNTS